MVWCGAIALVTGTHVGAFQVGAGAIGADLWLQAFVHIKALSIPASEAFRAGHTLVRTRGVHTLFVRTGAWLQTLINILTLALPCHPIPAVTVLAPERPHSVDAATLPTHVRPQTFIHIYTVSTLLIGHKPCWANTQETSLCVLTTALGAEVLDLSTFINVNALPLLLTELVALIADTGIPHRQVDAVSCSADVWVHSTFVDFCDLGGSNHLASAGCRCFGGHFHRHRRRCLFNHRWKRSLNFNS